MQDASTAEQEDEPAANENHECEPEFISGEEDYMDSDFEGREGYRKGVYLDLCTWPDPNPSSQTIRMRITIIMCYSCFVNRSKRSTCIRGLTVGVRHRHRIAPKVHESTMVYCGEDTSLHHVGLQFFMRSMLPSW